jgi:hypothetical protein
VIGKGSLTTGLIYANSAWAQLVAVACTCEDTLLTLLDEFLRACYPKLARSGPAHPKSPALISTDHCPTNGTQFTLHSQLSAAAEGVTAVHLRYPHVTNQPKPFAPSPAARSARKFLTARKGCDVLHCLQKPC